jgi:hypothetical protein
MLGFRILPLKSKFATDPYWGQPSFPLLPPVHREELWYRLKRYMVADAVIEAVEELRCGEA